MNNRRLCFQDRIHRMLAYRQFSLFAMRILRLLEIGLAIAKFPHPNTVKILSYTRYFAGVERS